MKHIIRHAATALLILATVAVQTAFAATTYIHVHAATGDDTLNTGASWASPYETLTKALAAAALATPTEDDHVEIWIAAGTYKEASPLAMQNHVRIYGGFSAATPETDTGDREFDEHGYPVHVTALDGNNTQRVFYNDFTSPTALDASAVLDSVTVQNGRVASSNDGAGMYNSYASPTIANCTFKTNTAGDFGGGMENYYSSPTITGCTFIGNKSEINGGGMSNSSNSSPTIADCTFIENKANAGGGMCNSGSTSKPTITNCTFSANEANGAANGGAMQNDSSTSPTITGCTFTGNKATSDSGFAQGGAMYNVNCSPTITNCTFSANTATSTSLTAFGGAMQNNASATTLANCTFSGNTASGALESLGGAMYNYASSASSPSPTLTNCTLSANTASGATGAYGGAMYNSYFSTPALTNCIIWGNTATTSSQIYNDGLALRVNYSIVQGGHAGTGNKNADPLLTPLADNGGLVPTMPVAEGSPAIGAGATQAKADTLYGAGEVIIPPTDAIGQTRNTTRPCTIGAVETEGDGSDASDAPVTKRPAPSVYETRITARTSVIREMNIKYNYEKDGQTKTRALPVHYRAPVAKKYTILMAYDGGGGDTHNTAIGRIWAADKQKALKLDIDTYYHAGLTAPSIPSTPSTPSPIGAKGQNIPESGTYYNAAAPALYPQRIHFTGLATLDLKNGRRVAAGAGVVYGEHFTPLPCQKAGHAPLEQGGTEPWRTDPADKNHTDCHAATELPNLYYPAPCLDDAEQPRPAHFHGTYATRYDLKKSLALETLAWPAGVEDQMDTAKNAWVPKANR